MCLWCKTSINNQIFIYTFNVFPINRMLIEKNNNKNRLLSIDLNAFFLLWKLFYSHQSKMLSFLPIKLYRISASIDICTHDNISHWISRFRWLLSMNFNCQFQFQFRYIMLLFGFLESQPQKWFCHTIRW